MKMNSVVRGRSRTQLSSSEDGVATIFLHEAAIPPSTEVSILPHTDGAVGGFEPWMVEWLDSRDFDVVPNDVWRSLMPTTGPRPTDTEIEGWVDELIAAAIAQLFEGKEPGE